MNAVVRLAQRSSKAALLVLSGVAARPAFAAEPPPAAQHDSPDRAASDDKSVSDDGIRAELEAERQAREALEARVARQERLSRERLEAPRLPPLTISGFTQVDWVMSRESSQDEVAQDGRPLNEDRFAVRRARIRVERAYGLVHGVAEIDANTNDGLQVRPINVETSLKWPAETPYSRTPWALDPGGSRPRYSMRDGDARSPFGPALWFRVSAGLIRTLFGFETPEWDFDRPFLERSTVMNALFPGTFDLGANIVGGFHFVRYALAVMNGAPIGDRTFAGRDPNRSKDLVFRVGGASSIGDDHTVTVEGGVSGLSGRGFHRGNPATTDVIQWQDANADGVVDNPTELNIIPGAPATPSESFKRFAVGADLRVSVRVPILGALRLRGEIVRGSNLDRGLYVSDPVAATRDLRQLGWYVGGSQEITRWAEVGVRYDRYDPDSDAREQEPFAVVPRDLSQSTLAVSAIARLWVVRLMAEYDHRNNALGRDASGRPTTLADDSFTLRSEMRF